MKKQKKEKIAATSSEGETEEGNSSNTDCDQDIEVSFMRDTDADIDTAETEEEDWIEYMKRSHETSRRKDEGSQYPLLDCDTLKDEMEIGIEDRFTPRDKMVKKKHQNGIQALALDAKQAEQWEDRERGGKTTSINSSSLRKQKKLRESI